MNLQTWIGVDGKVVNVSLNLLQEQLLGRAFKQYGEAALNMLQLQLKTPLGTIQEIWKRLQGGI